MPKTMAIVVGLVLASVGWADQVKFSSSDGETNDLFGNAICLDSGRVLVGAVGDDDSAQSAGAAYVFEQLSDGSWVEHKIASSDPVAASGFGFSVSLSGNLAVVGAYKHGGTGAVYVFSRTEQGVWSQLCKVVPADAMRGDQFGYSVSIDGATLLVGAPHRGNRGSKSGAAYVIEVNRDGTWESIKLSPARGRADDRFGAAVAISPDRVVVGAPGTKKRVGAVYSYERSGPGQVSVERILVGGDGVVTDGLGKSLALSGSTIVAGANRLSSPGRKVSVGAIVFEQASPGEWSRTLLDASMASDSEGFGESVAISGDVVLIGATGCDLKGSNAGAVYRFDRQGDSWAPQSIVAQDGVDGDLFGMSVSIDGGLIGVGANANAGAGLLSGAVYLLRP